jgi:Zn-dependent protease with chaperone function
MLPVLLVMLVSPVNYTVKAGASTHAGVMPGFGLALVLAAVLLALPGSLVFLAIWRLVCNVFRHAGVGGVLLAIGARPPDLRDLEEKRLVDVVQEMAIAAALPPPRVMIIDRAIAGNAANAAAVGWSISDATIVVTRALIEDLTRDQTEAVIAHVVASVGNGDLRIAFLVLSVFETIGLVRLAIHGTHRVAARRTLARFLKLAMRPSSATDAARRAEEEAVMALIGGAGETPPTSDTGPEVGAVTRTLGCLFAPILVPLDWTAITIKTVVTLSAGVFAGPVIGAMWRRRQMLADATAVQLTRNPDALAGALERMCEVGVIVPRGAAVSHLFAAWWGGASGSSDSESAAASVTAVSAPLLTASDAGDDGRLLLTRQMHASPAARIAALRAMGAQIASGSREVPAVQTATAGISGAFAALPIAVAISAAVMVLDMVGMSITLGAAGALMFIFAAVAKRVLGITGS